MRELADNDAPRRFLAEWAAEMGGHGGMRGAWDAAVRDKEMDHDGVAAEVVFPDADSAGIGGVAASPFRSGLGATGDGDPELVTAGAWAHNRWLVEFCGHSPERRAGVAIVPLHDIPAAVTMIEWSAEHGLRGGIMIPTKWGKLPSYNDLVYDAVWAAAAETRLPGHTHSRLGPHSGDHGFTPRLLTIH